MSYFADADFTTLMRQSSPTVSEYFDSAITRIDGSFGDGYAAKHPELVGAYINACAADFAASSHSKAMGGLAASLDSIAGVLTDISDAMPENVEQNKAWNDYQRRLREEGGDTGSTFNLPNNQAGA